MKGEAHSVWSRFELITKSVYDWATRTTFHHSCPLGTKLHFPPLTLGIVSSPLEMSFSIKHLCLLFLFTKTSSVCVLEIFEIKYIKSNNGL